MAGGIFNGICYPSQAAALDAYYSAVPLVISGGSAHRVEKVGISWTLKTYRIESTGALTYVGQSVLAEPSFPVCDPAEAFLDGVAIGWGIAAAVVMAAIYKWMRRAAT